MKTCYRCKRDLELDAFRPWGPYREGVRGICRECEKAYDKARYHAGPKRTYKRNPEAEELRRLARYGLTPETYAALRESQGGRCATCRKPLLGGRDEHIDHEHRTGLVRGVLCHNCNVALGHVKENPDTLRAMIRYLASVRGLGTSAESRNPSTHAESGLRSVADSS